MSESEPDTDLLMNRVHHGDDSARQQLLGLHRERLRKMVAIRMDRRLCARIDPSDVIQDVLADADRGLSDYLRRRPLPFYAWLRQLAWDRLFELHRQHVRVGKRSVNREQPTGLPLPDESAVALAQQLFDRGSSPSDRVIRLELCDRVRAAIDELAERDREVLILRHLEQLTTRETADALGISESAVKARHVRALTRLQGCLHEDRGETP